MQLTDLFHDEIIIKAKYQQIQRQYLRVILLRMTPIPQLLLNIRTVFRNLQMVNNQQDLFQITNRFHF